MSSVSLSSADMREIARRASRYGDVKRATDEVVREKQTKRQQDEARYNTHRMTEDKRRIQARDAWPLPWLPVKSQPWITNLEGGMATGRIEAKDLLTVLQDGREPVTFASLDDLVQWWSVD
jgi:hypothetical protein